MNLNAITSNVDSLSWVWGDCKIICTWLELRRALGGYEITVFTQAQGMCYAAPLSSTYSGTSPKPGAARASAAKILQYSRLMFWILHPYGLEKSKSHQQGSSTAVWYACLSEWAACPGNEGRIPGQGTSRRIPDLWKAGLTASGFFSLCPIFFSE